MTPGVYTYKGFEIVSDKHPRLRGNWAIYSPVRIYIGRAATLAEAKELINSQIKK